MQDIAILSRDEDLDKLHQQNLSNKTKLKS